MKSPAFEKLEQSAYRTTTDHGFLDLLLGVVLVHFTLALLVWPWIVLALIPLMMAKKPLLASFRRRIVEPRIGHVQLSAVRLDQISAARKSTALAFLLTSILISRLEDRMPGLTWLNDHPPIQLAIIVATGTAAAGWMFELPRFLVYSLIVLLAPILVALLSLPPGSGWVVATVVVLGTGITRLYRFCSENPATA